jgi:hypothetical protein
MSNWTQLPNDVTSSILYQATSPRQGGPRGISRNLTTINQPEVGRTIRIRNLSENSKPGRKFDIEANVKVSKKNAIVASNKSNWKRKQNRYNTWGHPIDKTGTETNNVMLIRGRVASMGQGNKQFYMATNTSKGQEMVPVFISYPKIA